MAFIDPIHWKWLIPEIALFPSKRQRMKVWDWVFSYGQTIVRYAPTMSIFMAIFLYTGRATNLFGLLHPFASVPVLFLMAHVSYHVIWRSWIRRKLRGFLRDIGRCQVCGYKHMEGSEMKCTECGHTQPPPDELFGLTRLMLGE